MYKDETEDNLFKHRLLQNVLVWATLNLKFTFHYFFDVVSDQLLLHSNNQMRRNIYTDNNTMYFINPRCEIQTYRTDPHTPSSGLKGPATSGCQNPLLLIVQGAYRGLTVCANSMCLQYRVLIVCAFSIGGLQYSVLIVCAYSIGGLQYVLILQGDYGMCL